MEKEKAKQQRFISQQVLCTIYLFCFFCLSLGQVSAQDENKQDTVKNQKRPIEFERGQASFEVMDTAKVPVLDKKKELNPPTRAALFAAAIPGLGQVYNKKYWKVPLAYGGFVVFASLIDFNNVRYELFRDALALKADDDDDTNPTDIRVANGTVDQLRRGRDRYRRDRDFNIILTFAWYGLTVADAVVDAHLSRFNINEDISAKLRPSIIDMGFNQPAVGIKLVFYLGD